MDQQSIAGQNSSSSIETEPRFPGEDAGESLAKMAQSDLDAALQLLTERAQYITGASGAAIALRREGYGDMLCRASAGSNAPELGALLSTEYGLSGESVRTRQALRCDDAERDPRVNREGCRQLGIASVVVMPIVSEEQVLGVFELFSGKPHAFEEGDLSVLQRLSEMVEIAVRHAIAAQGMPVAQEPEPAVLEEAELEKVELKKAEPEPASKSRLFWSAAVQTPSSSGRSDDIAGPIAVPLELRSFEKCKACGFPVSRGRTFCVECEEKQWRGQRLPQADASAGSKPRQTETALGEVVAATPLGGSVRESVSQNVIAQNVIPQNAVLQSVTADVSLADDSTVHLSSAAPSESWFVANKYILGALLVVVVVVAAIAWLR